MFLDLWESQRRSEEKRQKRQFESRLSGPPNWEVSGARDSQTLVFTGIRVAGKRHIQVQKTIRNGGGSHSGPEFEEQRPRPL